MKKNGSLVFIVLALGITWVLWIPALVLVSAKGYPLPTIDYLLNHRSFAIVNSEHGLAVVLFSLAVYGPLLAGLIVTLMEGGANGRRNGLPRCCAGNSSPTGWGWYS